jgi:molybdopterin synthase catalytic subunit
MAPQDIGGKRRFLFTRAHGGAIHPSGTPFTMARIADRGRCPILGEEHRVGPRPQKGPGKEPTERNAVAVTPPEGDDWVTLTTSQLPVHAALDWAVRPDCGAVVSFSGTVRDHAEGRPGVTSLEYEAYEEAVEPRLAGLVAAARRRWPELGRLAVLHRCGRLVPTETSVVVVASAPHREEAFDAARWCIDTLKRTIPIWKRETWAGGDDWSACGHAISDLTPADAAAGDRP